MIPALRLSTFSFCSDQRTQTDRLFDLTRLERICVIAYKTSLHPRLARQPPRHNNTLILCCCLYSLHLDNNTVLSPPDRRLEEAFQSSVLRIVRPQLHVKLGTAVIVSPISKTILLSSNIVTNTSTTYIPACAHLIQHTTPRYPKVRFCEILRMVYTWAKLCGYRRSRTAFPWF